MKINKEELFRKIKILITKLRFSIKTVYSLPYSGRYLILAVVLFIIFAIATFPFDSLINRKLISFEGKIYKSIIFSKFDFSVFGDTYCDNLSIEMNNGNEVTCKNIILNMALNPVTLLIQNRLKSDFQFDSFKYNTKDYDLLTNINGKVDITFDNKTNTPLDGILKIILSDSVIKFNNISIPGPMGAMNLKIDSVNIQSGNIDTVFNRGNCRINTFKLSGNDISCNITGSLDFNGPSRLDITISIDSESTVLDPYRDILGSFIKDNMLMLRLKGTLSKPELTLLNSGKNEN